MVIVKTHFLKKKIEIDRVLNLKRNVLWSFNNHPVGICFFIKFHEKRQFENKPGDKEDLNQKNKEDNQQYETKNSWYS